MWVTQTYLGKVEQDADAFIYYLFQDYDSEQVEFTQLLQRSMEELGELFGDRVSLLMPNPRYAVRIESEVRERVQDLWWSLQGKLPGLLFTSKPLNNFDGRTGDYLFVPLPSDIMAAAKAIRRVRQLANDHVAWKHAQASVPTRSKSIVKRLYDALELKPGIGPIKIDLKKLGNNR